MTEQAQAAPSTDSSVNNGVDTPATTETTETQENDFRNGEWSGEVDADDGNNETAIMEASQEEGDSDDDDVELPELTDAQRAKLLKQLKIKLKVDGKEDEVDIETLKKAYGLDKTATKRLQEASEYKAKAIAEATQAAKDAMQKYFDTWKSDPRKALQMLESLGHDTKKLAKEMIWEEMQDRNKTPEQRELEQYRKEKKEREEKEAADKKAEELKKQKVQAKEYGDKVETLVLETLKIGGFKPNPISIARISEMMQHYIKANKAIPTPQQLAEKVRGWYHQDISDFTDVGEKYTTEQVKAIFERLPKTTQAAIKQLFITEASATKAAKLQASHGGPPEPSKKQKPKPVGVQDLLKHLDEKYS